MNASVLQRRLTSTLALVLVVSATPTAHQVDDYLGITHVAILPDRLRLDVSLTPGLKLASGVLSRIDLDGDGRLSAQEQRSYGELMTSHLTVAVDDRRLNPRLMESVFPERAEVLSGEGLIHLKVEVEAAGLQPGRHTLFVGNNSGELTVFLINALKPDTPDILILKQERDWDQRQIRIRYEISPGTRPALWLAVVGVMAAGLALRARRSAG